MYDWTTSEQQLSYSSPPSDSGSHSQQPPVLPQHLHQTDANFYTNEMNAIASNTDQPDWCTASQQESYGLTATIDQPDPYAQQAIDNLYSLYKIDKDQMEHRCNLEQAQGTSSSLSPPPQYPPNPFFQTLPPGVYAEQAIDDLFSLYCMNRGYEDRPLNTSQADSYTPMPLLSQPQYSSAALFQAYYPLSDSTDGLELSYSNIFQEATSTADRKDISNMDPCTVGSQYTHAHNMSMPSLYSFHSSSEIEQDPRPDMYYPQAMEIHHKGTVMSNPSTYC